MSQHDYTIDNQSYPSFRTDLNNSLSAINSTNSGSSRPSSAVAGTIWLDTSGVATSQLLKLYDGADDILLGTVNFTANTVDWTDSAITLGANSVDSDQYVDGSIDTIHIGDSQITVGKMATNSVDSDQYVDGSIDTAHIADSTVSLAKLTATGTKDATTFLRGDNTFAAAGGGGKVLQVVSVNKTDTFSSSSTSFTDITGLTATITPSATSSKILVNVSIYAGGDGGARYGYKLVRVSTDISLGDAASSRTRSTAAGLSTDGQSIVSQPIVFLDSPSSTSSTTYKIQGRSESGNNFMVNRSSTDTDSANVFRLPSTITLIEIGV